MHCNLGFSSMTGATGVPDISGATIECNTQERGCDGAASFAKAQVDPEARRVDHADDKQAHLSSFLSVSSFILGVQDETLYAGQHPVELPGH
jgi:hypothetical protein